jgi:poly(hydroxyalkanoate) depolymerase family esterase
MTTFAILVAPVVCVSASKVSAQGGAGVTSRGTLTRTEGSRAFVVYRPARDPARGTAHDGALVVMLHGCVQTADDMARGTRMNAAADSAGFIVLYLEQPASAHPQKCWNWYLPEHSTRGRGEVAVLAAMIDSVALAEGIGPARISLVGMSAGAAMAANLAVAYPERYAALALHSGIPALGAKDVMGALSVMRLGAGDDDSLGVIALAAMGEHARAIPVIVLHGDADKVVSSKNLRATVREWTYVNAHAAGATAPVEEHLLPGVGHAWSGGSADGTYTAPSGPDATGMIVAFFRRLGSL